MKRFLFFVLLAALVTRFVTDYELVVLSNVLGVSLEWLTMCE